MGERAVVPGSAPDPVRDVSGTVSRWGVGGVPAGACSARLRPSRDAARTCSPWPRRRGHSASTRTSSTTCLTPWLSPVGRYVRTAPRADAPGGRPPPGRSFRRSWRRGCPPLSRPRARPVPRSRCAWSTPSPARRSERRPWSLRHEEHRRQRERWARSSGIAQAPEPDQSPADRRWDRTRGRCASGESASSARSGAVKEATCTGQHAEGGPLQRHGDGGWARYISWARPSRAVTNGTACPSRRSAPRARAGRTRRRTARCPPPGEGDPDASALVAVRGPRVRRTCRHDHRLTDTAHGLLAAAPQPDQAVEDLEALLLALMDVLRGQEAVGLSSRSISARAPPVCALVRTNVMRSPVTGFSMTSPG